MKAVGVKAVAQHPLESGHSITATQGIGRCEWVAPAPIEIGGWVLYAAGIVNQQLSLFQIGEVSGVTRHARRVELGELLEPDVGAGLVAGTARGQEHLPKLVQIEVLGYSQSVVDPNSHSLKLLEVGLTVCQRENDRRGVR